MGTDEEQERLLRALHAPGSDAELSEEERYRAMFRTERGEVVPTVAARSRVPHRLVVGGAAAAVIALGTGGVAAAYTGSLPEPVQRLAHHVIGAPAVSPPPAPRAVPAPPTSAAPRRTPTPTSSAAPSASSRPTQHPSPRHGHAASPSATASATTSSSPTPTPTPSASAPATATAAPVLTGVMVVGTSHRADVGARVSFSGQLTWSGTSAPVDQRVVLQQRVGSRWVRVARGRADVDGAVALTAPPLLATTGFRLRAGAGTEAVHSTVWRVAMHPLLSTKVTAKKRTATIAVEAQGSAPGDVVTLVTRRDGRLVIVGQTELDVDGSGSFTVRPDQRRTSYAVVLDPTKRHTSARAGVVVRLPKPSQ